ncbi:MAG TPA: SDR family oxidoreductase, partial [candidate division Zixibacteria bacterium]|nr:SDR family oxidoreductase [candidate division Zixibacteria bacterium]
AAALEMRNHHIKINYLSPGSTDTNFGYARPRRSSKKNASGKIQLTAEQVAEAIVFLAKQDENAFTMAAEIRPLITKKL